MRMLLLNAEKKILEEVNPSGYEDYLALLDCSMTERYRICLKGYSFLVIADDAATFVRKPRISAITWDQEVLFYGNLLIGGITEDGDYAELTDEEMVLITEYCCTLPTALHPEGCFMLTEVGY